LISLAEAVNMAVFLREKNSFKQFSRSRSGIEH